MGTLWWRKQYWVMLIVIVPVRFQLRILFILTPILSYQGKVGGVTSWWVMPNKDTRWVPRNSISVTTSGNRRMSTPCLVSSLHQIEVFALCKPQFSASKSLCPITTSYPLVSADKKTALLPNVHSLIMKTNTDNHIFE